MGSVFQVSGSIYPNARLVCFPPAAGNAYDYCTWKDQLETDIALFAYQPAGRGLRLSDPLPQAIDELAREAACTLASAPTMPTFFFGHSLGAVIAYETMLQLRRMHAPLPLRLIASACFPPQLMTRRRPSNAHLATDREILSRLGVFAADGPWGNEFDELLSLIMPSVRNELALLDAYRPTALTVDEVAVTAVAGITDTLVSCADAIRWGEIFADSAAPVLLNAGHHYLKTHAAELTGYINSVARAATQGLAA